MEDVLIIPLFGTAQQIWIRMKIVIVTVNCKFIDDIADDDDDGNSNGMVLKREVNRQKTIDCFDSECYSSRP